ncbi:MAG TPA: cellulose synthase [Streptosporangiaceae bacterium]|nr:cellulose synthase [Streptosporangiaceae bacterium]
MPAYNAIAWLPLCAGLTGIGLVASWFAMRRRGLGSGLRGAAWSLLPIAAYLTGSIEMFWKIGTAIGDFATSFVFSPKVWSGVAVAGLAAALFVVSGGARRRRKRLRRQEAETDGEPGAADLDGRDPLTGRGIATRREAAAVGNGTAGTGVAGVPGGKAEDRTAVAARPGKPAKPEKARKPADPVDDDMREVEEILRRRGIS